MTELVSSMADKIDRTVQRVIPLAYRVRRTGRRLVRRALRKPRSVSEGPNLLPLLIQVLASFTKADGIIMEEEIDSSLGFLRYDYPEAVYSELRQLFRQALYEQQDLAAMAQKLGIQLSTERKIMLGVQLYDLISQAGLKQEQVVAFYSFMSQMGMAAQAIDIVYQLNASEESDQKPRPNRPADGFSLSRSHSLEKLQRPKRLGAWQAAGAWRVLPNLSRSKDFDWRPGAQLSGAGAIFQCKEERFAPTDFHQGKQGCRASATGAIANARERAASHVRTEGARQGLA